VGKSSIAEERRFKAVGSKILPLRGHLYNRISLLQWSECSWLLQPKTKANKENKAIRKTQPRSNDGSRHKLIH
jgi:hypothetical protein